MVNMVGKKGGEQDKLVLFKSFSGYSTKVVHSSIIVDNLLILISEVR